MVDLKRNLNGISMDSLVPPKPYDHIKKESLSVNPNDFFRDIGNQFCNSPQYGLVPNSLVSPPTFSPNMIYSFTSPPGNP